MLFALVVAWQPAFVGRAPNSAGGSGAVDPTAPKGAPSKMGQHWLNWCHSGSTRVGTGSTATQSAPFLGRGQIWTWGGGPPRAGEGVPHVGEGGPHA